MTWFGLAHMALGLVWLLCPSDLVWSQTEVVLSFRHVLTPEKKFSNMMFNFKIIFYSYCCLLSYCKLEAYLRIKELSF